MKHILLLITIVTLASCASDELEGREVKLPSGRVVECVADGGRKVEAIDCDWNE